MVNSVFLYGLSVKKLKVFANILYLRAQLQRGHRCQFAPDHSSSCKVKKYIKKAMQKGHRLLHQITLHPERFKSTLKRAFCRKDRGASLHQIILHPES
jgi:hypothetical protein